MSENFTNTQNTPSIPVTNSYFTQDQLNIINNEIILEEKTIKASEISIATQVTNNTMSSENVEIFMNSSNTNSQGYTVYTHSTYGRYIDAREFGIDTSGKTDSLSAIKAALAAANAEGAAVYLSGKIYISDQIVIDSSLSHVTGLFGDGMGATVISFNKAQEGVYNSNTNEDDIRAFAGVLVDGVNGLTIGELSVQYTNSDYYRRGESYFGKVSGIMINDADNTLVTGVEVSGANRAGVLFSSTQALTKAAGSKQTYKVLAATGKLDETDDILPTGENNRIENSYLHHNRVAGVLVSFQENFVADGNTMSWNGHVNDGGTGYGIATLAGSYNYGVTYTNNQTDHNYRKGYDAHDGTDIVISNNISNGDRLYGIAVYNRQFSMDNVKITDNTVIQDSSFRLPTDDDLGKIYHGYSGIQLETNTQRRDLFTEDNASYEISGNKISGLTVYQMAQQTYGIEFRNYEHKINYTLDIMDNTITGESSKYLIAILNDTSLKGVKGIGSGEINISGNEASIGQIVGGGVALFVNEANASTTLHGSVTVSDNNFEILKTNGYAEGMQLVGNAETYTITDNTLTMIGNLDKTIISVLGNSTTERTSLTISDNDMITSRRADLYSYWIGTRNADYIAIDNTHNGKELAIRTNLSGKNLATFTAEKEAADALDSELTTIFDIEGGSFNVTSLFTDYDATHAKTADSYEYSGLNDTFTVDTNEVQAVI